MIFSFSGWPTNWSIFDLLDETLGQVGSGDEGAHAASVRDQAALDGFLAHGVDVLAVLILGHQLFPDLAVHDVALGEDHVAFTVVDFDNFHLDLVADLDVLVGQVFALDQAVGLVSDVDTNLVVGDLYDRTGDGLAGADSDQGRLNVIHEAALVHFLFGQSRIFLNWCGFLHSFLNGLLDLFSGNRLFYFVLFRFVHNSDNLLI